MNKCAKVGLAGLTPTHIMTGPLCSTNFQLVPNSKNEDRDKDPVIIQDGHIENVGLNSRIDMALKYNV